MILAALALAVSVSASQTLETSPDNTATVGPYSLDLKAVVLQMSQPRRFDPARFDSATAQALWTLLDTASLNGIPEGPLINKALQGAAMGAKRVQILSTVRTHYANMLDAREALGRDATASELDTGADAIRAGIDAKSLVSIRSTRPTGTAVTALVVLTDLIRRGIPNDKAREAVMALTASSRSDEALNGLQANVAKSAARGGPAMALDALDRYVRSNAPRGANPATPKPVTRPPSPPDDAS